MEFVYVNDAYADLFGYDPEEMIGEPWHLVYLDEQIREVRESVAPTLQEEGYWYEERTFERADGETFLGDHVIALSKTGDGVCIVRDITERRDYERDLAFERDRFQGPFAAIPEPVVEVDVADDGASLRDVNAAFEDTFGYEASEVVGGDLNEVIVPDDECLRTEAEAIDEWAAAGEQLTWEVRRETTDGVRDFLFRSAPIEHDGEVAEQFGLYVDITERKRYERTLEQQNERLEEFTSAVSHDLRGPLSTAEGRLELARADCDSPHLDAVSDAMEITAARDEGRPVVCLRDVASLTDDRFELERFLLELRVAALETNAVVHAHLPVTSDHEWLDGLLDLADATCYIEDGLPPEGEWDLHQAAMETAAPGTASESV